MRSVLSVALNILIHPLFHTLWNVMEEIGSYNLGKENGDRKIGQTTIEQVQRWPMVGTKPK